MHTHSRDVSIFVLILSSLERMGNAPIPTLIWELPVREAPLLIGMEPDS